MYRQMFLPLIFGCLLVSNICADETPTKSKSIQLGFASIEVLYINAAGESHHMPNAVIRISGQQNRVQSYGVSNEAGLIIMPLPPGKYCYDAFSAKGEYLPMRRKGSERCFTVENDDARTIGIEILSQLP
jgi:hypothetical protein